MTRPLFEFENVSVQRGSRLALRDFSLLIDSNEHVAIVGPNGSGKSTLIKLITRECYPLVSDGSRFRILGQEIWNIFELRPHLGIVSNELAARYARDITGRELVLSGFFGSTGLFPNLEVTPEMEAKGTEAMRTMGVKHLADRWTDELSSGELRRLLIARAMIHSPETLLLDEPTTSLDLPAQRDMHQRLRTLAQSGTAIVLVTHHLEEIIPEIDRVVFIREGSVFADGPKEKLLTTEGVSALFGTPVHVARAGDIYRAS